MFIASPAAKGLGREMQWSVPVIELSQFGSTPEFAVYASPRMWAMAIPFAFDFMQRQRARISRVPHPGAREYSCRAGVMSKTRKLERRDFLKLGAGECPVLCAKGFDVRQRVQDIVRLREVPREFLV
jgi:hypothetical protein